MMTTQPRLLYCVLNWGLGHASRSAPVIRALLERGYKVDIASDGGPLKLLQETFPGCATYELPGYHVRYPSRFLLINALSQIYHVFRGVRSEKEWVAKHLSHVHYHAIISDNRYGCHHPGIPSILITHVVRNMTDSRLLNFFSARVVDGFLNGFDEIWVPDTQDHLLSGRMSEYSSPKLRYIGYLSDQKPHPAPHMYHVAAILSGPEPQRTYLEEEVRPQLEALDVKCALVRGVMEETPPVQENQLTVFPYKNRSGVNMLLNSSDVVVCRTGYSSLMDLLSVGTKAIIIPTPGQPEQEYLGAQLKDHPQFMVQHQGKIQIEPGMKILNAREDIQPPVDTTCLLDNALNSLTERIAGNGWKDTGSEHPVR